MKNKILYLSIIAVGLSVASFFLGYYYHDHKYRTQIEAGINWEYSQYMDSVINKVITDNVQIVCNFGNKKTFDAKNTDLTFTEKDFDSTGHFIGYEKNFLIQKVCGISYDEAMNLLEQEDSGIDTPSLFNIKLIDIMVPEQNFGGANFFMDNVSQCPDNVSVPEQFDCLYELADVTEKEADALANKLISQAPIRLEEITTKNIGPVSFVYGGSSFLTDLPIQVKRAQKVRDEYIKSVCNLTSMTIYGGSGMDLEQNACRYYFINEYLQILKSLEGGLTAVE